MLYFGCMVFILMNLICSGKSDSPVDPGNITSLNPGVNEIAMQYDGLARSLTIQLPIDFQQETSYPVFFFFHGLGGNKGFGLAVSGHLVDEEDFIGIYPQGHLNSWNAGSGAVPSTADDVGFTMHILDWLKTEISVDEDHVYSAGYSNGGAFSYTLALSTDVFAAVASLSASFFVGRTIPDSVHPLSVLHIHGELDQAVPYEGGQSNILPIVFQSAMSTVKQWAVHNGLDDEPEVHVPEDRITVYTFQDDENPHEVRLYCLHETTHDIGTHPFVSSLRCYREIWEFFERHPKVNVQ